MLFLQAAVQPQRVHRSFQALQDGEVTLCVSLELLSEVRDVLTRDKVRDKFPSLTPEAVDAFISETVEKVELFDRVPSRFTFPLDPNDDHIFNLAISAGADYLVTWDKRILRLETGQSEAGDALRQLAPQLRIVNPEEFATLLRTEESSAGTD